MPQIHPTPNLIASIIGVAVIILILYLTRQNLFYTGGAPQAAIDVAMDRLVEVCNKLHTGCGDFRPIRAQEKHLTPTAQAQHAEAAWCVELQTQAVDRNGIRNTNHLFIEVARTGEEFFVLDSQVLTEADWPVAKPVTTRDELWNSCLTQ